MVTVRASRNPEKFPMMALYAVIAVTTSHVLCHIIKLILAILKTYRCQLATSHVYLGQVCICN